MGAIAIQQRTSQPSRFPTMHGSQIFHRQNARTPEEGEIGVHAGTANQFAGNSKLGQEGRKVQTGHMGDVSTAQFKCRPAT